MSIKDEVIVMFRLNSSFQKYIFNKIIMKYGGSIKAEKIINIPASSIRGYRNLYFKTVPKILLDKLVSLNLVKQDNLDRNILERLNMAEVKRNILSNGRLARIKQLRIWREEIPKLKDIVNKNILSFEKWFDYYFKLINFGARKFNYVKKRKTFIEVNYTTHSNKIKKEFVVKFPRKIKLDEEFIYFFGLWCGDRVGGKRFGICNQNKEIIKFTEYFLKKNNQSVEKYLYIQKDLKLPNIHYDKKFLIDKEIKGWVLSVHSTNGIFSSFFHYIQSYLEDFLSIIQNKYIFFAGLFDAEGNVSLYNKSFRWACKNKQWIQIYSKNLKELGLYHSYDGHCIISINLEKFYKEIFPYLKQTDKVNSTKLMLTGEGNLPSLHLEILRHLKKSPNKTSKEIAKALKKNKVYSELWLLSNFNYILHEGYPNRFGLASKGLKLLGY